MCSYVYMHVFVDATLNIYMNAYEVYIFIQMKQSIYRCIYAFDAEFILEIKNTLLYFTLL